MDLLPSLLDDLKQKVETLRKGFNDGSSPLLSNVLEDIKSQVAFLQAEFADVTIPSPLAEQDLAATRRSLIDAFQQAQHLLSSPEDQHQQLWENLMHAGALRAVIENDIPFLIPMSGSITFRELASCARLPENPLARMLRYLMTYGIFCEPFPCTVAHTAQSLSLCDASHNGALRCLLEEFLPASAHMSKALKQNGNSQFCNTAPWNLAYKVDIPAFQFFDSHERRNQQFTGMMTIQARKPQLDFNYLVQGFPWAKYHNATVIDVGGNSGITSLALAEAFPSLNFIVQDRSVVVEDAAPSFLCNDSIPSSIRNRITYAAHDFFEPQRLVPIPQAATANDNNSDERHTEVIYLLRDILHDWSDKNASRILQNIIPALESRPDHSRMFIADAVMPDCSGILPIMEERRMRSVDLAVYCLLDARDRELREWHDLLAMTDRRLKLVGLERSKGSRMGMLEVVLEMDEKKVGPKDLPQGEENDDAETFHPQRGYEKKLDDMELTMNGGVPQNSTVNGTK